MNHGAERGSRLWSWLGMAAGLGAILVIGFGIPLGRLVPLAVLLLCPILIMRMHGSGHAHGAGDLRRRDVPQAPGVSDREGGSS